MQQQERGGRQDGEAATALLLRLEQTERQLEAERRRTDHLLTYLSHRDLALARIEQQLTRMESRGGNGPGWTPAQWLKILAGLALPLLVLLLTGNVELARKLLAP